VGISATGSDAGQVGDVETGDLTPAQFPGWCARRRLAGVEPIGYCNRSNLAEVRRQLALQAAPWIPIWLSTLDGSLPWGPGIVAIQHQGAALTGGHYDCSLVSDQWPGLDSVGLWGMTPDQEDRFLRENHQIWSAIFKPVDSRVPGVPGASGLIDEMNSEVQTKLDALKAQLDGLKPTGAGPLHITLTGEATP